MKYTVFVAAHEWGHVEVEADSEEEAIEIAYAAENNGDIYWGDRDVEIIEIEEVM